MCLQVGRFIQWQGGVVTAEQLAPFLDAPKQQDRDSTTVDEGFVVPALVRFGGSPEVDERGNLLYRFPDLQKTGRMEVSGMKGRVRHYQRWGRAKLCTIGFGMLDTCSRVQG